MILLSNRLSRIHASMATSAITKPRTEPTGAASSSRRVLRGGAYSSGRMNVPAANRDFYTSIPHNDCLDGGFRLATTCDLSP